MGACDIIVIVAVSVAFLAAIGFIIFKKVRHKGGGCGCGCEGCPHACHRKGENKKEHTR